MCRGFGADFCCKSEIRTPALWGRKAGTDRVREGIPEGFRPTEQACALWRRGSAEALAHPTYFFCGSSNFSPFLNTAKIACEGQASKQRRQLSKHRDESNLYGGVESQAPVGQIGTQMA